MIRFYKCNYALLRMYNDKKNLTIIDCSDVEKNSNFSSKNSFLKSMYSSISNYNFIENFTLKREKEEENLYEIKGKYHELVFFRNLRYENGKLVKDDDFYNDLEKTKKYYLHINTQEIEEKGLFSTKHYTLPKFETTHKYEGFNIRKFDVTMNLKFEDILIQKELLEENNI